jgi:hypothetical protein
MHQKGQTIALKLKGLAMRKGNIYVRKSSRCPNVNIQPLDLFLLKALTIGKNN